MQRLVLAAVTAVAFGVFAWAAAGSAGAQTGSSKSGGHYERQGNATDPSWEEARRRAASAEQEAAARKDLEADGQDRDERSVDQRVEREGLALLSGLRAATQENVARARQRLAALSRERDYARAEAALPDAQHAAALLTGLSDRPTAISCDALLAMANLHLTLEDGPMAFAQATKLLAASRAVWGPTHPRIAGALLVLGRAQILLGQLREADASLQGARSIISSSQGTGGVLYALSSSLLGQLALRLPDLKQAEHLLTEAAIVQRASNADDEDYADTLTYLGQLCLETAQSPSAETHLLTALRIRDGHADRDWRLLMNLSRFYRIEAMSADATGDPAGMQRDLAEANRYARRWLDEAVAVYGKTSIPAARALQQQGETDHTSRRYGEAEHAYADALGIQRSLGNLAGVRDVLVDMATLFFDTRDYRRGQETISEALKLDLQQFWSSASARSEEQQIRVASRHQNLIQVLIACAQGDRKQGEVPDEVYDQMLASKSLVMNYQRFLRNAPSTPEIADLRRRLATVSANLSTASTAGSQGDLGRGQADVIESLRLEREQLQAAVATAVSRQPLSSRQKAVTVSQVRAALPARSAFLDFRILLWPKVQHTEKRLVAFLTRRGGSTTFVDLGRVDAIEGPLEIWRAALDGNSAASVETDTAAATVGKLVWQPLMPLLGGVESVFVSPDGPANRLPFAALPANGPGHYLIESTAIAIVPTPQIFAERRRAKGSPSSDRLLLVGDIDFSPAGEEHEQASADMFDGAAKLWGRISGTPPPKARFRELPGASTEITDIRRVFGAAHPHAVPRILKRDQATERAFFEASAGATYVHIASHGFYVMPSLPQAYRDLKAYFGYIPSDFAEQISVASEQLVTGIALTGANGGVDTLEQELRMASRSAPAMADGILTAEEVSALDLRRTSLVVLSACETALGNEHEGEGVLGLERAFHSAGAKTVIASLWHVDDGATAKLMTRFYANVWNRHMGKLEALREAQLSFLPVDLEPSAKVRRGMRSMVVDGAPAHDRSNPALWAAWMLSGEPN